MEYLDGNISRDREQILRDHLNICETCREEFKALESLVEELNSFDQEEPPINIEEKVIKEIKRQDRATNLLIGVAVFLAIAVSWIGIVMTFKHTPIISIMNKSLNTFFNFTNIFLEFAREIWKSYFAFSYNIFAARETFKVIQELFLRSYRDLALGITFIMLSVVILYDYLFKTRRMHP
jgi:hypothetical protein